MLAHILTASGRVSREFAGTRQVCLGTRLGTRNRKGLFDLSKRPCFLEAPVGVEPTVADLQSAALATWLRRRL